MRIINHPILGVQPDAKEIEFVFDGKKIKAFEGEMIATSLMAAGVKTFRHTEKNNEPRGIFCAIGRCTDCVMEVDGVSNVRTCVTPIKAGMTVNTQKGIGQWKEEVS